jgi:hypothetical protein
MTVRRHHIMGAAKPAAKRAGAYAIVGMLMIALGSAWVTDGFKQFPKWRSWVEMSDHANVD